VVVTSPAASDGSLDVQLVDDLAQLVAAVRVGELAAAAIDMPIGLFDDGPRPCDVEARALLQRRRSTVFPAPARVAIDAVDYGEACEMSRNATGKALSKQTFNIIGPIRQLDHLLRPDDADRIVEAHPELAFARLAGEPLPSKHSPEGRAARESALRTVLGSQLDALIDRARKAKVPRVDLFDAAVLTVTARHVVAGTEHRLGGHVDPTGKPAQVVY
jgi:predicted RNase H-like nuclease